jgi:hypothetical protein
VRISLLWSGKLPPFLNRVFANCMCSDYEEVASDSLDDEVEEGEY